MINSQKRESSTSEKVTTRRKSALTGKSLYRRCYNSRLPLNRGGRMTNQHLMVYCTCPDRDTATRIASALVERRQAACANIVPGLVSIYRWEGAVQQDGEELLLIKT